LQSTNTPFTTCNYRDIHFPSPPRPNRPSNGKFVFYSDPDVKSVAAFLAHLLAEELAPVPNEKTKVSEISKGQKIRHATFVVGHRNQGRSAHYLSELQKSGVPCAIHFALDSVTGRFAAIRTMIFAQSKASPRVLITTDAVSNNRSNGTPDCIFSTSDITSQTLNVTYGLLVMSGHANPMDAGIGPNAILCGRISSSVRWPNAFPCFTDGQCFRQHNYGRKAADSAGLVSPGSLNAALLVIGGCNVIGLGDSWYDLGASIAVQAFEGQHVGAVLAPASAVQCRFEFYVLLMAMLMQGKSLGDAVVALNRCSLQFGEAADFGGGGGPWILAGHPSLALTIGGAFVRIDTDSFPKILELDLNSAPWSPGFGVLVCIRISSCPPQPLYITVEAEPGDLWCRGLLYRSSPHSELCLWINTRSSKNDFRSVKIDVAIIDEIAPLYSAISQITKQTEFWITFLRNYVSNHERLTDLCDRLRINEELMLEVRQVLLKSLSLLSNRKDLVFSRKTLKTLVVGLRECARRHCETLLQCSLEIAAYLGTLQSEGWESSYCATEVCEIGACLCGKSNVWARRYEPPFGGLPRFQYQCGYCGPLGEDSGSRFLLDKLTAYNSSVSGRKIELHLRLTGNPSSHIFAGIALILEKWHKDGSLLFQQIMIDSSFENPIEHTLTVHIPPNTVPGVYAYSLVGVVNGELCISRRYLTIAAHRSHFQPPQVPSLPEPPT
jgi:hypothetical protein